MGRRGPPGWRHCIDRSRNSVAKWLVLVSIVILSSQLIAGGLSSMVEQEIVSEHHEPAWNRTLSQTPSGSRRKSCRLTGSLHLCRSVVRKLSDSQIPCPSIKLFRNPIISNSLSYCLPIIYDYTVSRAHFIAKPRAFPYMNAVLGFATEDDNEIFAIFDWHTG